MENTLGFEGGQSSLVPHPLKQASFLEALSLFTQQACAEQILGSERQLLENSVETDNYWRKVLDGVRAQSQGTQNPVCAGNKMSLRASNCTVLRSLGSTHILHLSTAMCFLGQCCSGSNMSGILLKS